MHHLRLTLAGHMCFVEVKKLQLTALFVIRDTLWFLRGVQTRSSTSKHFWSATLIFNFSDIALDVTSQVHCQRISSHNGKVDRFPRRYDCPRRVIDIYDVTMVAPGWLRLPTQIC